MSSDYMSASEDGPRHNNEYPELPPADLSADSSANTSRPTSAGGIQGSKRGRVRFNSTSEANDTTNQKSRFPLRDSASSSPQVAVPKQTKASPTPSRSSSLTALQRRTPETEQHNPFVEPPEGSGSKPKPTRPSLLRNNSSILMNETEDVVDYNEKTFSALAAQQRAQRNAISVGSAPPSRRTSFDSLNDEDSTPPRIGADGFVVRMDDIPLMDMDNNKTYDGVGFDSDDEDIEHEKASGSGMNRKGEAHRLIRVHTRRYPSESLTTPADRTAGLVSGQVTPQNERDDDDYVPRPPRYRGGVLGTLLKLYNQPRESQPRRGSDASGGSPSNAASLMSSGTTTPTSKHSKWYNHRSQSQDTLAGLIEASAILGAQGGVSTPQKSKRPGMGKRTTSGRLIDAAVFRMRPRLEDEFRITVHLSETLSRQKFLLRLCHALMAYGAPTHRLEEYMKMTARVLEIDGQFLYLPGCMIVSFDDVETHTTEVKIVRSNQGVDLGRLEDIHFVYKNVTHDDLGVEEATQRLNAIIKAGPRNHRWFLVFVYGLASASVGPFAFNARPIDMPIAFFLGCILGWLQLIIAPRSDVYTHVFEVSATILTSFLARVFGSINDGNRFCFSALAQSSIALILPGYLVLCGAMELQSKNMVAGAVRMVHAIIYALFLGYGITIGTALYGMMDHNASSATTCLNPVNQYLKWLCVPIFTLCLCVINQAKWKQMPVMVGLSFAGYIVNFFTSKKFPSSAQLSSTAGAIVVGVLANLYSRLAHGVAAAAIIPAIFVQVPSGLAASGSLLAGISTADQITNTTTYKNGTAKINGIITNVTTDGDLSGIAYNFGYHMIQVAIGITIGLFVAAALVYPFGKRRSGLFSF